MPVPTSSTRFPREPERPPAQQITVEVDDQYLLMHMIQGTELGAFIANEIHPSVAAVQKLVRELSADDYSLVIARSEETPAAAARLLALVKDSSEFGAARQETLELRTEVDSEWRQNAARSTALMREVTGFEFGQDTYRVFVTHPSMRNGAYFGNQEIAWGGMNEWPNYRMNPPRFS